MVRRAEWTGSETYCKAVIGDLGAVVFQGRKGYVFRLYSDSEVVLQGNSNTLRGAKKMATYYANRYEAPRWWHKIVRFFMPGFKERTCL